MAAAIRVQHSVSMEYRAIGATRTVYGDREVAQSVVYETAMYLRENLPPGVYDATLRSLTIKPLSDTELMLGLHLINELPVILVVPSELNMNPRDGKILISRQTTMHLDRAVTMLAAKDRYALLAQQGSRTSVKLLCLSKQSYEALCREVRRVRMYPVYSIYSAPPRASSSGSSRRPLLSGASRSSRSSGKTDCFVCVIIGMMVAIPLVFAGGVVWGLCNDGVGTCQTGLILTCAGGGLIVVCCCIALLQRCSNSG